jgi:glycerophosphoryl diester phosphodiesterase
VAKPRARPLLLGHRGVRPLPCLGLRWRKPGFPAENTLAAFDYAVASGCDGFEFDVRFTRDRRSVLCHDAKLNRREVADTEYAGLERRSGYNLACLEDVLARYSARTYLDIELKVPGNEEAVVAALRDNPPQRGYVVSSFLPEVLMRLHEIDPALPLGYICEHQEEVPRWTDLPVTVILPHHALVSQRLIDDLHQRNTEVLTWTVNDPEDMVRLASWGVDGLISDDPRLLANTVGDASKLSPQPASE